ncbi:hypothetical protein [Paenibacillus bouchesdurhonensis]|uniref:hypothetical protein n=1 Tax=Paenibacillus bouchesdurhonensis TaxID=1870990 RepID=UPI000DA636D5|nr:hypothetical protein [Paenibacillus bouchesdurhonensis]
MKITEYTVIEEKGLLPDGKTPYQFFVVKLGDNMYFKDDDHSADGVKIAETIDGARHIASEKFALELIGYLQNFYDSEGKVYKDKIGLVIPPLVGLSEAAEMLGWQKQQVSEYMKRGKFPDPLQRLASGPIWTYKQIEDYKDSRS